MINVSKIHTQSLVAYNSLTVKQIKEFITDNKGNVYSLTSISTEDYFLLQISNEILMEQVEDYPDNHKIAAKIDTDGDLVIGLHVNILQTRPVKIGKAS